MCLLLSHPTVRLGHHFLSVQSRGPFGGGSRVFYLGGLPDKDSRSTTKRMSHYELSPIALLLGLLACTDAEDPAPLDSDTGEERTTDTQVSDTGLPDSEVFFGTWSLVRVDDTDGVDNYPIVEEDGGCLNSRGWTLQVEAGFVGVFEEHLVSECPGKDPLEESLGTYDMKGAYIIDRTFTIRIKDWELALTCVVPEGDDDKVSCDGVDDSGPLILDFERAT